MQVCKFIAENSDYEVLVSPDGQLVTTRKDSGFEFLFKSAKTNFGIRKGHFMYEVKIIEFLETDNYYGPGHRAKQEFAKNVFAEGQNPKHIVRVGYSNASYQKILGSDIGGSGIAIDNLGNKHYGGFKKYYHEGFEVGDVIRCCIEIGPNTQNQVSFYKNGKFLRGCYDLPITKRDKAWFPMVSIRNVCVEFNFGKADNTQFYPLIDENAKENEEEKVEEENKDDKEKQDKEGGKDVLPKIPQQQQVYQPETPTMANFKMDIGQYKFVNQAIEDEREYYLPRESQGAPKLIMLVGLPSSGKSTFAEQYLHKYPQTIWLGTAQIFNHILEHFKIVQVNQKIILLMELCDEIFIKLMKITALTYKDVIIDQCNIFLRARLEKLSYFKHHQTEAVVLVSSNIEQEKRLQKKEKKQERYLPKIGNNAMKTMKENFIIPSESEGFYRVHFIEVDDQLSRKIIFLGKEISELQIHPLLRKKNFKQIDDFKTKHNIKGNYADFDEIKRKIEAEKLALIQQEAQKQLQLQQQKEQNEKKGENENNGEQSEKQTEQEQNKDAKQGENDQQNKENTDQNQEQNKEKDAQVQQENQQNQQEQKADGNQQQQQNQQAQNNQQPVNSNSNLKRSNPVSNEQSEVEVKGIIPPNIVPEKPRHNQKHQNQKIQKSQNRNYNNNQNNFGFNRLDERKGQQFPYSNQQNQGYNQQQQQQQQQYYPSQQQQYAPHQPQQNYYPPQPQHQPQGNYQESYQQFQAPSQPPIQAPLQPVNQPYHMPQQQYPQQQHQQQYNQQQNYYPPQQQQQYPPQQYQQGPPPQYDPSQQGYYSRR